MTTVRAALVQMQFSTDADAVLDRAVARIHEAARQGAGIICFPELATSIYFPYELNQDWQQLAEPVPGRTTERLAQAAADAGVYIVFPLYEREGAGELYNTAVIIGPDGELVGRYRKNSIPLAHSDEMDGFEKYYFRPGNLGYPVFETSLGIRIGIVICYERHFPEGPRILTLGGADVLFVPTATCARRNIWELELRAHAAANMIWVGGVNRVGRDTGGGPANFFGSSMFCDPEGRVVASASDTAEEILFADLDTSVNERLRRTYGWWRDRRPELYTALTAS
jgi:beta-ureidopropionase